MPTAIVFLDDPPIPDYTTEIHFFEDDEEAMHFSRAHYHRQHLVRPISRDRCHWGRIGRIGRFAPESEAEKPT